MDIKLTLVTDIYDFIEVVQKHPSEVKLTQGDYIIDGKSVLGVFTLNLKEKFLCVTEDGNYSDFEAFVNKM